MDGSSAPALLASLGRVRWGTVATLTVCAVLSWLHARDASTLSPATAALVTPVALVLALGIMGARQLALRSGAARTRFYALLATYILCGVLGLFGLALASLGDDGTRGALFALGGAIFTLGSPPGFGAMPKA